MAKWPGSALYFHAQILSVDDDDKEVQVLFSEGSEMKLPFKYIEVGDRLGIACPV